MQVRKSLIGLIRAPLSVAKVITITDNLDATEMLMKAIGK